MLQQHISDCYSSLQTNTIWFHLHKIPSQIHKNQKVHLQMLGWGRGGMEMGKRNRKLVFKGQSFSLGRWKIQQSCTASECTYCHWTVQLNMVLSVLYYVTFTITKFVFNCYSSYHHQMKCGASSNGRVWVVWATSIFTPEYQAPSAHRLKVNYHGLSLSYKGVETISVETCESLEQ